jgi:hypothetical protein
VEKILVDTATWLVALSVAELGAAANQDWSHAHGRFIGASALLAVLLAALKNFPQFNSDKPAAPGPEPKHAPGYAPPAA